MTPNNYNISSNMFNYENDSSSSEGKNLSINVEELKTLKSENNQITIGFDFGTHQTKICIESKGGVELSYTFVKFSDHDNKYYYALPSIIGISSDGYLHYGYLPKDFDGNIIRYFKQCAFSSNKSDDAMTQKMAMYYSIWYIAYILFSLEELYGQQFTLQIGVPTDSSHLNNAKQIATRIFASSYKLVEEVYENDKLTFLKSNLESLIENTEIVDYSDDIKEEYGLLIFPEAYACLKPLISQKRLSIGMNLLVDIGGGTTDISFFTIDKNNPQVFDFYSMNKGLNYLTCADERRNERTDSIVLSASEIDNSRRKLFMREIDKICNIIRKKLTTECKIQAPHRLKTLLNTIKNRPIIYCGGGSTFSILRVSHDGYVDVKQISEREWNVKSITQIQEIKVNSLFPILSTAYGLAISTESDNIPTKQFRDILENARNDERHIEKKIYEDYEYGLSDW